MSKFSKIKAEQLKQAEETGVNPYAQAAEAGAPVSAPQSLAHYQAAMKADIGSLAKLPTLGERAEAKKGMIPAYWPFVDDYIQQGHDYPNDVAVRVMIWLFDIGDIERALNLAFELIKRGNQKLPEKFDRQDLETFVCDAAYDWANALLKQNQSASPYLDWVVDAMQINAWDVHPAVSSKMLVMLAKHMELAGNYAAVVELCDQAEQVNPEGAGVKTLRDRAKAKIKL